MNKKVILLLVIILITNINVFTQIRAKEGVYQLSIFGSKERAQIFYKNDTLRFIKIHKNNNKIFSFYRNDKNELIYTHESDDFGKVKIKFYNSLDEFKIKKKVFGIWIGFKGNWKSDFRQVDNELDITSNRLCYFERNYIKNEYYVTMRDGVKLFTQVYTPKNINKKHPAILIRTPYGLHPYGAEYPAKILPSYHFAKEGYILVYQDIRGRYMSEGEFRQIAPLLKTNENDTDEATDTYDTADWLIKNLKNHNGKIGVHGISFSGYLASVASTCGHPAIKAVSSQAPMANGYFGDDFRRNGALYLTHSAFYLYAMGQDMNNPGKNHSKKLEHEFKDSYKVYNQLRTLNAITDSLFDYDCYWWNAVLRHEDYINYWLERSVDSYAQKMQCPNLIVGGWYDAENLTGSLRTFNLTKQNNPNSLIVMGPWFHGGWSSNHRFHDYMGNFSFEGCSEFFEENIELPFFNNHLKLHEKVNIPKATMYDTGVKKWQTFNYWPPRSTTSANLYLNYNSGLEIDNQKYDTAVCFEEYLSNPFNPVPYTTKERLHYYHFYFTENQKFSSERNDVITFTSEPLKEDITIAGQINPNLFVSTTGTDCDWVVKVIDVNCENDDSEYELLIRGDILRGKYRNNFNKPEPFVPNEITNVTWFMPDVLHTIKKGHRIKIHIQSSWFPLYDINPQKYCKISEADTMDFNQINQKVFFSEKYPSSIRIPIIELTETNN